MTHRDGPSDAHRSAFNLIGVLYLPPMPGAGNYTGMPIDEIVEGAARDAETLRDAGFDAALLQNATDVPEPPQAPIETVAAMAAIGAGVRARCDIPLGVCVAHNDGAAAIAVSYAIGATFVRVKVLTGVAVGAAGLTQACAAQVAALRSRLPGHISVFADVHEVTSVSLGFQDPAQEARQHVRFGGADGVIFTSDVGALEALAVIAELKAALGPAVPVLIGGRVTDENIGAVRQRADGAIVATSIRTGTELSGHIDLAKAAQLARA
jgi:membrane complex biogenesis BtpA family protein